MSFNPASKDNKPSFRDFSASTTILSIVPVKSNFSDKTTFLKTIAGLLNPDSGNLSFEETILSKYLCGKEMLQWFINNLLIILI